MSDYRGLRWIRGRQDTPRKTYEEIIPSSGWTQVPNFHYLLVDLPGFKKDDVKLQIDKSGTIVVSGERLKGEGKHVHFEKAFKVPEDVDTEGITIRFEGETLRVTVPKMPKEKKEEQESNKGAKDEKEETQRSATVPTVLKGKKEEQESNKGAKDEKALTPGRETGNTSTDSREGEKQETERKGTGSSSSDSREEEQEETQSAKDENGPETNENKEEKNASRPEEENSLDQTKQNSGQGGTQQKSVIGKLTENKGILIASLLSFTLGVLLSQKFHPPPAK